MKEPRYIRRSGKVDIKAQAVDGMVGNITINGWNGSFVCGYNEHGMEHVSVAPYDGHTTTWDEMCEVKDVFWNDEEECVMFFPKKSEYVNLMKNCLHIWRRVDGKSYDSL